MPTLHALALAAALVTASAPSLAPARFSWDQAARLTERLRPAVAPEEPSRRRTPEEEALSAAEACTRGNLSGRACAAAERRAGSLVPRATPL